MIKKHQICSGLYKIPIKTYLNLKVTLALEDHLVFKKAIIFERTK